ncbi:MAG: alpha/beta fold hydrolase [Haloferacaceae archaeon]
MTTLSLDDGRLWYESRGTGPPLVFVHGGWSNGDAWRAQMDRFAEEFQVVTFDVRGHGRTGVTDRRRYSIDLFVDDLRRLLDHLDADRPLLCGLSLGSMVVQSYLDRHPAAVRGAVLAGPARSMPPVDLPPAFKAFTSPLPAVSASVSTVGTTGTFRALLGSIRATKGSPWLAVDADVRAEAMDAVADVSNAEFRKIFGALYRFDPPDLSHVSTPTLVVYGDRESPALKRQGATLASSLPDARRVSIPDAAHLVNQDAPAAFNDAVAEFLGGVETLPSESTASRRS